ncbi:hypothetical protein LVB77_08325 [Lysobacter sp. 5GHs7-4]|uniref:hypothetical protein n=1 Tax=Lysobacter sp. 5GHs7-4 TaxID=2904253 RepID=UPI001E4EEC51|nr:hypothetical protein [Lysobacter sp. 5GHs7-4]UHQ24681.1 hypothetical protein LVB77_08325 [Lysobacter sp. 5GHs7-4]
MTVFVHIADERDAAAIRRSGLKLPRLPARARGPVAHGVFALPVVPNFVVSHQWVRELKRRGFQVAVGVYFRVDDEQPVLAGTYNDRHQAVSAAQAAAHLREHGTLGYEVLLPRSILASEIVRIRALPQTLGWRYFPGAHERGVFCGCRYCQRGEYNNRRIREAYRERYGDD